MTLRATHVIALVAVLMACPSIASILAATEFQQTGRRPGGVSQLDVVGPAATHASNPETIRLDPDGVATESALSPRERALELLPEHFRTESSRRFIIMTDAHPDHVRTQIEILERTWHQVARFSRRLGLPVEEPKAKQVVIFFAHRDNYLEFAHRYDDVQSPWVAAYYSPYHQWTVLYDFDSNPAFVEAQAKIRAMQDDVDALRTEFRQASRSDQSRRKDDAHAQLEHYRSHVEQERMRIDRFIQSASTATTIHEATHQLLHAIGLQRRDATYPFWFNEGIATCFETDEPGSAFGPDHAFTVRDARFREYAAKGHLMPLSEFLRISDPADMPREQVDTLYHQAYGFMQWISRSRRSQLRTYLELMRDGPAGSRSAEQHAEIFEQAFGDIHALERAWLRDIDRN